MDNLFASSDMAAGYAAHRPAVHPQVLRLASQRLAATSTLAHALDVGCGSGVSSKALREALPSSPQVVGLEPAESMLRAARAAGMLNAAVAGRAESLPFSSRTFGLITAAGSLNYTEDLPGFFAEAARVLQPSGTLAVYDFSPGRIIAGEPALRHWFDREFMIRYPRARDNARFLDPAILATWTANSRLSMTWAHEFQIPLQLDHAFYVDYMMTETNVAYAIANGTTEASIREWCSRTLAPIFQGQPKQVVFEGYLALFSPVLG
jgi:ubiquinone/menaquinone biosynthesis C-methylase UbiE